MKYQKLAQRGENLFHPLGQCFDTLFLLYKCTTGNGDGTGLVQLKWKLRPSTFTRGEYSASKCRTQA